MFFVDVEEEVTDFRDLSLATDFALLKTDTSENTDF